MAMPSTDLNGLKRDFSKKLCGPHSLNAIRIRIIRTFCNTVPSRVYIALGDAQLYESMGFTKYTFPWGWVRTPSLR